MARDQFPRRRGEDVTLGENRRGALAQGIVLDQLQAQQRGEDAERVAGQCGVVDGPEGGGVHRHASHGKIVVTHRMHAHHGEQATQHGHLFGAAHTDGAVALDAEPLVFGVRGKPFRQGRVACQGVPVHLVNQLEQRLVLGDFGLVHGRHGAGKAVANDIGREVVRVGHVSILLLGFQVR